MGESMFTLEDMERKLDEVKQNNIKFEEEVSNLSTNDDHFFLVIISFIVFLMQCGFAFLEAGSVRSKNTVNILLKNMLDTLVGGVSYWALGWGFAYGHDNGNSFIGGNQFFNYKLGSDQYPWLIFQFVYAACASTIVSGAIAERCRLGAYMVYCFAITSIVYPPVSHWTWDGGRLINVTGSWTLETNMNNSVWKLREWSPTCERTAGNESLEKMGKAYLEDFGMLTNETMKTFEDVECGDGAGWLNYNEYFKDFAGSGCIHLLGGTFSLVACFIIGARQGRFDKNGKPVEMAGHSVPLAALGGFILIFGFLAFNGGSQGHVSVPGDGAEVGEIIINSLLGGCSGGLSVLLNSRLNGTTWSFLMTLNGALAGMVSLCAGCDSYEQYAAIMVGAGGGTCYLAAHYWMLRAHLDDPLDAVAVHGAAGLWGLLIAPFFNKPATWDGVLWNFIGALVIMLWSGFWSFAIFYPFHYFKVLRISEQMEHEGIDIVKHGEPAYPANAWEEEQYAGDDEACLLPTHKKHPKLFKRYTV